MRRTATPHKDITPYILDNPVGIDTIVKSVQAALSADLTWLEKSFNRATIMSRLNTEGEEEVYPVCWSADGKDEFKMIGNDNWTAYSFFVARDSETAIDYDQFDTTYYERDLSLYVWVNLEKVDPAKTYDYIEEIKQEIIVSIRNVVFENDETLEIESIEDDPLEIFNGFTVDPTETQLLYYPYKGLRFDFNCTYADTIVCSGVTPPPSLDPDAQAWINRMVNPTALEQSAINTFVLAEKASGNWALYDEFYCYCFGPINSLVAAKVKTSSVFGGATFPSVDGVLLNGVNGYLDSNFTPSVDGVNYTLADGQMGVFIKQTQSPQIANEYVFGARRNSGVGETSIRSVNSLTMDVRVQSNLSTVFTGTYNDNELLVVARQSATEYFILRDGVAEPAISSNDTDVSDRSIFVGSINVGSPFSYFNGTLSVYYLSKSIAYNQVAGSDNIKQLLTDLGQTIP